MAWSVIHLPRLLTNVWDAPFQYVLMQDSRGHVRICTIMGMP